MFRRARAYVPTAAVASHVVLGAVAGYAATWLMGTVTSLMYERESREARRREDEARGHKAAYVVAAEKVAALLDRDPLTNDERERWGRAIHWGLGITAGAIYGVWYALDPSRDWKRGLAYGAGFFLLVDEIGNTALGLTPPPRAFPWQTHARGLVGHLVYGVTADAALRLLERPALSVVSLSDHVTP